MQNQNVYKNCQVCKTTKNMFFTALEKLYVSLDDFQEDESTTKLDVLRSVRSRVASILSELVAAPHIGTAFEHPADLLKPASFLNENVVQDYEQEYATAT